ncbi:repressor protein-like protein [Virus Rctr197k]|nr:repressor protein-like protein [Virus Rctr197k]
MGWATEYIEKLSRGETVQFRPRGNSMSPRIRSGQLCTVEPIPHDEVKVGDIVLCAVGRAQYLHFVGAIDNDGEKIRFLISNNRGGINGRTTRVYGKLVKVES